MGKQRMVEVHTAWVWDCDECGRENFERAQTLEADEQEIAEMRDEYGVQPWETGDFVAWPESVTCAHCNETFDVDKRDNDDPDRSGAAGDE